MFNYNQIIEYIDGTYSEEFNEAFLWCKENNATFDELLDLRKEVKIEYVENEETKTKIELHRFFKINKIPDPEPLPEPTLEELKLKKHNEINTIRDNIEQGGFMYMGKIFDSDSISCQRISCAAQALQFMHLNNSGEVPTITWTCADNSHIKLTALDLAGLVVALADHSNKCHEKATQLKEQVEKAQTKEELDKIVW